MHKTKNDLAENIRERSCALLNSRLADCVDLYSQTKQAHWNVRGNNFIALHDLFDKLSEEIAEYVDIIAERVIQLGGVAEGTVRMAASRSILTEYPLNISEGRAHLDSLTTAYAQVGKVMREAISASADLRDDDTADICTQVSRGLDKSLWLMEAHIQT